LPRDRATDRVVDRAMDGAMGKQQSAIDIDKEPWCEINKVTTSQDDDFVGGMRPELQAAVPVRQAPTASRGRLYATRFVICGP
jgi:hypothetical protein